MLNKEKDWLVLGYKIRIFSFISLEFSAVLKKVAINWKYFLEVID